ncbi:hypothetical protein [Catalinimonas niigatensis]|uniref:hypothetical protein n=1 Tax=Catalinimonas niigatensis TaxID=1397264 RepID=UPI00266604CB|nr:hypothetical protein [Catalinimonas niigatensis]WPP48856.1 hypothetical protein PZB72_19495 [Catalinimonas niigatensis]
MKKKFTPYNLILLVMLMAFGCRSANVKGARENFDVFYEKFLSDSSFQMERIQFPLPGIKTIEDEEDSTYQWTKEEWVMLKEPDLEGTEFKRNLQVSDTLATDEIFTENAGFYFKMVYEPIKRKWHLVYMVDTGL